MGENDNRRKEDPRTKVFQLRMSKDEEALLESLSAITDESKSDVIRSALRLYDKIKRAGGKF